MKITFEGKTFYDILDRLEETLVAAKRMTAAQVEAKAPEPEPALAAIVPEAIAAVDKPVDIPVEKPKERTAKQKENDERLRAAAKAKVAKKTAKPAAPAPEPEAEAEPFAEVDPAEIVKVRQKTLEDLQTAYAEGRHKEVLALLSVHGNGAKSFRELPLEAFIPIREAIDLGALTTKAPT